MIVSIRLSGNNVEEALDWAKRFCPSYITNTGYMDHDISGVYYQFFFSEDIDAVAFALRWL